MASNVSQPYPYNHTIFPCHEDEFCLRSATHSNSVPVPDQIHGPGMFDTLGGVCPSSITSSILDNSGAMFADHQQSCFPDQPHHHKAMQLETDPLMISLPATYPKRFGMLDLVVPDLYSSSPFGFNGGKQQSGLHDGSLYRNDSCDLGMGLMDYCQTCSDDDPLKPLCHELRDTNWGIQANQARLIDDDSSNKVGRYTMEERKDRILRFMKKRNQRNFNKKIKYACRKTLADRRVRVRGRFARNNGSCDNEEIFGSTKKIGNLQNQQFESLFIGDDVLIKHDDVDDEWWLQEATASLIYPQNCTTGCS